jgi:hypothetical protein
MNNNYFECISCGVLFTCNTDKIPKSLVCNCKGKEFKLVKEN